MILVNVMKELAARMRTLGGINAYDVPPRKIVPPASIAWPTALPFDQVKGRGKDRLDFDLWVAVGAADDASAWERLGAYCDGDGDRSVKELLESGNGSYAAFNTVVVRNGEFGELTVAEVPYLAVAFPLEVYGNGA